MSKRTEREKLLLLIDGSNLAHRAFQRFEKLRTRDGKPAGLIYGFMRLLNNYVVRFRPTFVIITFDTKESKQSNFRKDLMGSYKAHRKNLNFDYESFNSQMKAVKKVLRYMDIPVVWDKKGLGHESDDYIAHYALNHKGKVVILSSDKDFCQLIDNRVKVFNPFKETIIHNVTCKTIMGYSPEECVDYLCLLGDHSDDIPGYKGMGKVKTRQFLDTFGSIENFLKDPTLEFKGIDRDGLTDLYRRNKVLIDLKVALEKYPLKKIPIIYRRKDGVDTKKIMSIFREYAMQSFLTDQFIQPFKKLKPWRKDK